MELFKDFNPEIKKEQYFNNLTYLANNYIAIEGLIALYNLGEVEKSLVKAQNKVLISQHLPINNTFFIKEKKQKRIKGTTWDGKYILPTTWKETFKLIKLLWQTRQLA